MNCRSLFPEKTKKIIISLLSAEFALRLLKVKRLANVMNSVEILISAKQRDIS